MPTVTQFANSVNVVFAMMIAPARSRLTTTGASYGGTMPSNATAPPVVGMFVVLMMSFTAIGIPCRAPRMRPEARSRSSRSASSRAVRLKYATALI
jgi:hypothetical protein